MAQTVPDNTVESRRMHGESQQNARWKQTEDSVDSVSTILVDKVSINTLKTVCKYME